MKRVLPWQVGPAPFGQEGEVVAEIIAGHKAAFDVRTIPAVVFTDPEISSTGLTEEEAKAKGHTELKVGKVIWVAGHSGPETAEDSRTHFGIFETGVTQLFPETFVGVCMLPQSPKSDLQASIGELRRCVELGFVGCNLNPDPGGGHFTHPPLTDEYWFPLYEAGFWRSHLRWVTQPQGRDAGKEIIQ